MKRSPKLCLATCASLDCLDNMRRVSVEIHIALNHMAAVAATQEWYYMQ